MVMRSLVKASEIIAATGRKYWGERDCPGEVGFVVRDGSYSDEVVEYVIERFFDHFPNLNNFVLATSLHVELSEISHLDGDINKLSEEDRLISKLLSNGWIIPVDYEWFGSDIEHESYDHNVEALTYLNFRYFDLACASIEDTAALLELCMTSGKVRGFGNFVDPNNGLRLFPHDDQGFDVLALSGSVGEKVGKSFLRSFEDNRFSVTLKV